MTLMRLSYTYDIDTPNKERILNRILSENQVSALDGNLCMETPPESLYSTIMQFAQVVGKVSNMQLYKREIVQSLFYEQLADFIDGNIQQYSPLPNLLPIPERDDLEVDWLFKATRNPVYLFGVKDSAKSRLVTIACLEFQKAKLPFTSMVIHEDFDNLAKKDRKRITSAVDKQFPTLDDFIVNGLNYLTRVD
jgi:hypothetical protein